MTSREAANLPSWTRTEPREHPDRARTSSFLFLLVYKTSKHGAADRCQAHWSSGKTISQNHIKRLTVNRIHCAPFRNSASASAFRSLSQLSLEARYRFCSHEHRRQSIPHLEQSEDRPRELVELFAITWVNELTRMAPMICSSAQTCPEGSAHWQ